MSVDNRSPALIERANPAAAVDADFSTPQSFRQRILDRLRILPSAWLLRELVEFARDVALWNAIVPRPGCRLPS